MRPRLWGATAAAALAVRIGATRSERTASTSLVPSLAPSPAAPSGYNYQMGQAVFGLEGDGDWSNIRGSTSGGACTGTSCETRNSWLATARGRLGYALGRFMPYVTGGAAFGDIKTSIAGVGDTRTTKTGWTVGGGLEAAIAGPWTAKVEYLYVDLGDTGTVVPGANASFHTNIVRAGLNYRF
ncbi:MAG TPA: outer membrane protein [Pseudolabrys sp.]|nr:outer membrane protein [Pseudolabrys sp.]